MPFELWELRSQDGARFLSQAAESARHELAPNYRGRRDSLRQANQPPHPCVISSVFIASARRIWPELASNLKRCAARVPRMFDCTEPKVNTRRKLLAVEAKSITLPRIKIQARERQRLSK